jgi:predicted transcriptional regulator of viral defense system
MGNPRIELHQRLLEVASGQGGYFTARQAVEVGYADSVHGYHVGNGDWTKVHRGIYRLVELPDPEGAELYIWTLWSRGRDGDSQGVFCRETALALHGKMEREGGVMHMTVPRLFRRNSDIPEQLRLYKEDLAGHEVESMGGFSITSLKKTVADILESCTNPKILKLAAGIGSTVELKPALQAPAVPVVGDGAWDEVWSGAVQESIWSTGKTFEDAIQSGED